MLGSSNMSYLLYRKYINKHAQVQGTMSTPGVSFPFP